MVQALLTVDEVAALLRVSKATVYTMVAHRNFPAGAVVRVGALVRFNRQRILEPDQ